MLAVELLLILLCVAGLFTGDRTAGTLAQMQPALSGGEYRAQTGEYTINEKNGAAEGFLKALTGKLTPGVYRLELEGFSEADLSNSFSIQSNTGRYRELLANPVALFANRNVQTCHFYVTNLCDEATISVDYGGSGTLTVSDIRLVKTNAGSRMLLTVTVLLSLFIDMLCMVHSYVCRYPVEREKKAVWIGIPLVTAVASFPVFTDYVMSGADFIFHCTRIRMLAESMKQGVFPVRVEADWLYGHGYANSLFYCDTFLVFPAVLLLLGFSVAACYGSYIVLVNLATALIAYFSFEKIFRSRYTGLVGSVLYTLVPYRIYNLYKRSAVGEYTAMTFLPLLVLGFYVILTEDTEKEDYRGSWLIPTLGFSGIIQSHALSCEIAGGMCLLLCLLCIKRVFQKKRFLALVKMAAATALLNAWFLVPFVDMTLSGDYYLSNNTRVTIQKRGLLPANLFDTMQAAGSNSRFAEKGLLDTEPINVGLAVLLGTVLWFVVRRRADKAKETERAAGIAFVIGLLALVMSTTYFPWDALQGLGGIAAALVPMIQFPTRLTLVPAVCLTFVACEAVSLVRGEGDRLLGRGVCVVLCACSVVLSLYQTNDNLLTEDSVVKIWSIENIGNSAVLGAEYLPLGSKIEFSYHGAVPSEGVTVGAFEKEALDTRTELSVAEQGGEYYVELPMLFYKGYRAQDAETGEHFTVVPGSNYEVRTLLPAGYQGTLHVWYAGMWYWRAAEAVSLCAAAGVALWLLRQKQKKKS